MSFTRKILEFISSRIQNRAELTETDIPSQYEPPKKKLTLAQIISIAMLIIVFIGGGGFCGWYYIWRDVNPQHDYVNWKWTFPVSQEGEKTRSWSGRISIKEGDQEVFKNDYFKGNCFVYKQDKTLTLQSILNDNYSNDSIGPRVLLMQ
jgi:hypothetical protein